MPITGTKPPGPTAAEKAIERAKLLLGREDYSISKVHQALEPEYGSDLWEVLFLGRYRGNTRANIRGDKKDACLPYRCWVREDGTGFVTSEW